MSTGDKLQAIAVKGLIGGVSSSISVFVASPLDVLKIRFQMQGELSQHNEKIYKSVLHGAGVIIKDEGIRGLWKGITISLIREVCFTSSRFALYEPFRALFTTSESGQPHLLSKIGAGLCSGALASAMFNPTDILKIRFQADVLGNRHNSIMEGFRSVVREEGSVLGLYKGVGATATRAALLTCGQLASYDQAKHMMMNHYNFSDNLTTHFLASMFSGFMASLLSNPVDVCRTRIMNEKIVSGGKREYPNLPVTFVKVLKSEGLLGLYKGFVPSYTRLGLCTVIVTWQRKRSSDNFS